MTSGINPFQLQMLQLQRRQALADQMMQQSEQPLDTQFTGGPASVAVRRSPLEAVAKIAQAATGAYFQNKNDQKYQDIANQMLAAQQKALTGLAGDSDYGSAPSTPTPSAVAPPDATSSADTSIPTVPPPLITQPGYTPPSPAPTATSSVGASAGTAPSPTPSVGRGIAGPTLGQILSASQDAITYGVDPKVVEIAASARAPTPEMRNIAAVYGNTPQARAALERAVNPAVATNPNAPLARFNPATGQYETAYAPPNIEKGIVPIVENGQITGVRALPGANETAAATAAATTAATEAQKGHWVEDPKNLGQGHYVFPSPPAYAGGINDLGKIGRSTAPVSDQRPFTPADLEGQKTGAKVGTDYAADLNAKASDALAGKRTLSEMGNLLQGFTPGKLTPILAPLGSMAVALGANPDTVQKWTSVNPANAEAFQKGTAALAGEAAKQVTNRVTQTEFKVFLANNPNWMMTPDGIHRVMDFMGKGFDQQIDMQKQFADWSNTQPPNRWAIDFPAEYNRRQQAAIDAGKTNSTLPSDKSAAAPNPLEGRTASGPNGQKLIMKNGQWVPNG